MADKNAGKDASHFPRKSWIWESDFRGSKTVLFLEKNWADWCVAVVQKAGERRGFFSGIVCRFLCEWSV